MTEDIAFNLVKQYMQGWEQNNLSLITSSLSENCIIVESHGPTYHGKEAVEKWFQYWIAAESKIQKWQLRSFYYCHAQSIAFVEWDFSCVSNGNPYIFSGCSLYKINKNKINYIQEYRMTHPAYSWQEDKLVSE